MAARARGSSKTGLVVSGSDNRAARSKLGLIRTAGDHTPIAMVMKQLTGGKVRFMEFAALAVKIDPALSPVIDSYLSLNTRLRQAVSIDQICAKHDIDPIHFLGVVGEAAIKYGMNSAIVIASLNLPAVVNKSVKEALKPGGDKDRKMIFQHANFIPTPGGVVVNNNNSANAAARADSSSGEGKGLPSFERNMREADEVIRERD